MGGGRYPTTKESLLAPIVRWSWLAKFWLCEGIYRGTITVNEARKAHEISAEELNHWYSLYRTRGAEGLRRINRRRAA